MEQAALPLLLAWANFSVIIGSSAAVLIGLQFVVTALGAQMNVQGGEAVVGALDPRVWGQLAPGAQSATCLRQPNLWTLITAGEGDLS